MEKLAGKVDLNKLQGIEQWYSGFLRPLRRLSSEKKSALVKALLERIIEAQNLLNAKIQASSPYIDSANCADYAGYMEGEKLSNEVLVFHSLCKNPRQTKESLSSETGLSRATITRLLQKLVAQNKIRRVGANKNGYWEIIS